MSERVHGGDSSPVQVNRLILLGASNLTMSLYTVIELLQQRLGSPSDILVVAGHGRSYGESSQVLFRELPGIVSCGLWEQLDRGNVQPTYAFLTDIGNDIPYGYTAQQILGWVDWCVSRLQIQKAQVVMTNIPLTSIEAIPEWRYKMLRPLLFPNCRLSRLEVVERARLVHQGLAKIALDNRFELLDLSPDWFGADTIHVRIGKRSAFYRDIVERFSVFGGVQSSISRNRPWFSIWKPRPRFAYKKVLGQEQHNRQPSVRLTDGTTISMY